MNLKQDNFTNTDVTKVFKFQDERYLTPYHRYTYETYNALYDVDIRDSDGDKTYHINMGFSTEPHKIHAAIEKHFNI